jgi:hypothetical protein
VIVPPPHDPVRPLGVETASPAGKLSVNPIPVSDIVLVAGLVIVKLRALVPLREIAEGVKVLEIVGGEGATTVTVAVLLVPTNEGIEGSTALPEVLKVPPLVPVTLTLIMQCPSSNALGQSAVFGTEALARLS